MQFVEIGQFFNRQLLSRQLLNPQFLKHRYWAKKLHSLPFVPWKQKSGGQETATLKLETLMNLIAFEQDLIQDFFTCTSQSLKQLITRLAEPRKSQNNMQKSIEDIFCIMHQIKGDAAMLNMETLSQQAHDMETLLGKIGATSDLKATDLRQMIPPLKNMIQTLREIKTLFNTLTEGGWHKKHCEQTQTLALKLEYLIKKIAADSQKRVMIVNDGYTDTAVPRHLLRIVAQVVTQLARNAVVHGLETEAERTKHDKTPYGCFHISVHHEPQYITIATRDDGRGLDPKKIREAASKSKYFTQQQIAKWTSADCFKALFMPGFSTQSHVTQHAGRGVGMDVIKHAIEQHQGSIQVKSLPGHYTEFTMRFPMPSS